MQIQQLIHIMIVRNIDILCVQEVRRNNSDYFVEQGEFLVICSGSFGEEREWTGVGFIGVAPRLRNAVLGFLQVSNRMCTIKL